MTVDVKDLIAQGKNRRGVPVMSVLLEQIGKKVDALEEKTNLLRSVDKTVKTEFLTMYRGFFPKDQISKCLSTTTLPWRPINDVVSVMDYEPKYKMTFEIEVDLHEPWNDDVDRNFKNPYGMFNVPKSDEEVEQINHGLVWVDFQYGETNSTGFFLMTGAGLKALAETNPDLYRGLTSKIDGELHWKDLPGGLLYPITREVEWPCGDFDGEPEMRKLTNYYYWNYTSNQDGLEFIPHKLYEDKDNWDEVKWRERTDTLSDDDDVHDTPFEIMLGKVTADYLL